LGAETEPETGHPAPGCPQETDSAFKVLML
jgi:hypothetical protein